MQLNKVWKKKMCAKRGVEQGSTLLSSLASRNQQAAPSGSLAWERSVAQCVTGT